MDYGRIVNDVFELAPKEFIEDGKCIRGFTEEFLLERGYKPIIFFDSCPSEEALESWVENEYEILQTWVIPEKNTNEEDS